MSERSISVRYGEAVQSFVEFARTLTEEEWSTHVPCTPLWTARDVLSHVSGVPDDGLAGRLDGAATEPWTASQVERNAEFGVDELLDRLLGQHELFGSAIEQMGEPRPPFDCHSHEHDVRQAIGRPGNRGSEIIDDASLMLPIALAELPVRLTIDFGDGPAAVVGAEDATAHAGLSISKFEMFRSRLGRRSRKQVRAYAWSGDEAAIEAAVDGWFMFGPTETAIDE